MVTFATGETGLVVFSSTLSLTSSKIDYIFDSLNQFKDSTSNEVLGSVPLLDAGAGFGFSRHLRSRIKQVA